MPEPTPVMRNSGLLDDILASRYYIRLDDTWHAAASVEYPMRTECGLVLGLVPACDRWLAYGRCCPGELCAGCQQRTKEGVEMQARMEGVE